MTFRITLFLLLTTFVLGGCFEETEYHYEDLGDGDPADADSFEENPPGDEDGMESDRFADADFDADGDLDLMDGPSESDRPETPDGDGEMDTAEGEESDGDAGEIDPEIDPEPEDPCDGAPSPVVEAIDPDVGTTPAWRATAILDQAAIVCEDGRTRSDWGYAVAGISETEAIFGAHNGLWRYTATPTPEIRCIAGLEEPVYSIAVRQREGEEEIVVGLRDRVGILSADSWRFVPLPDVWLAEEPWYPMEETSPTPWDIYFYGDNILIQTIQGVAMQDESGVFVPLDGCCGYEPTLPFHEETMQIITTFRYVTPKTWTGMAFLGSRVYVGAPGALLEIDLESRTCRPLCRAEDPEARYIVQGLTPEGVKAVRSKPGYEMGMSMMIPAMPYTLNTEVGECTFQGIWKVHYRPGDFFPIPTFVKGRMGADGQWIGAFASFTTPHLYGGCEYSHSILALPGQTGGIGDLLAGFAQSGDWGMPCCQTAYGPTLTADVFMDSAGGWYSPGFWRIDYANETEE